MTARFWVIAAGWMIGVVVSAPGAFEEFDRNGNALMLPGLSPTVSEVIITSLVAMGPPLLAAAVIRVRRARAR